MLVSTILNRLDKHKSFVYGKARWGEDLHGTPRLEVPVRARRNGKPVCSGCGRRAAGYDRLAPRAFHYVPLWGIAVVLLYAMRRVSCPRCGVTVERVPWAAGKSPVTRALALYLAQWAKRLSWQEVAEAFRVNWHQVYASVRYVVEWGWAHRDLAGVRALGVDEIHFGKGQRYLTLVYQLCGDVRRLLYVGRGRDGAALKTFFDRLGKAGCAGITHVCSDLSPAYLKALKEGLPQAMHILDRFHLVQLLNKAVDEVRRTEGRVLRPQGVLLLKGLRYVFLKRPENLTPRQRESLLGVVGKRWLKTVRAYLWKEKFQLFWEYEEPEAARPYLQRGCRGAMRSRLEPLKKFVKTLRKNEALILHWFQARKLYSSGAVEGLNRKVNLVTRKSYGYRNYEVLEIALFHTLGHLPEPEMTHRF